MNIFINIATWWLIGFLMLCIGVFVAWYKGEDTSLHDFLLILFASFVGPPISIMLIAFFIKESNWWKKFAYFMQTDFKKTCSDKIIVKGREINDC